ncbi:MAG: AMP-binding protein [Melioribacter sp.]|uniref:AMP-binding protein n=1 Tax=Rosettibacter primus TaxID=3111523 RepID=UPI00247E6AD6|nr:AMP-binding protein [Melioribacter sp.]
MTDFYFNIDEANTLWKRWKLNSEKHPDREAIVHWVAGQEPYRWTYKNLIDTAKKFSQQLKKIGIKAGDVCAIIIRHNPFFYPLYLGISRIGALPAILAYPNPRLHPDKFRQGLEGMSQRSGLDYILTERELDPIIRPLIENPKSTIKSVYFPLEWDLSNSIDEKLDKEIEEITNQVKDTDAAFLQHSSGTTGLQKPVVLSHRAVLNHVLNLGKAFKLSDKDKACSWLPLYHDFGLIAAFHIPLAYGITTVQLDPFEWVLAPVILLEAITKEKATMSFLPNFAYNVLADKIHEDELQGIDLSSLRIIVNAAEPIRHDSHQKFVNRFQKYGFNPLALACLYGMAEATLGVTVTEPGKPITELAVDRNELSKGIVKFADDNSVVRICVSSGKLIDGCSARIVDDNRKDIPDGFVGEVAVKSVSQFDGYRNYPEKTAEVVEDGWYFTGDYGFRYNDEYFIIGRKKDIIIVAGKNIYPEDIEDAVNNVPGVIPGRVIAFGEEDPDMGTEFVSVAAETEVQSEEEKNKIRLEILKAGMSIDIVIHKVYLVPPRWLIKSSSGKPSRKANKERLLSKTEPQVWSR